MKRILMTLVAATTLSLGIVACSKQEAAAPQPAKTEVPAAVETDAPAPAPTEAPTTDAGDSGKTETAPEDAHE